MAGAAVPRVDMSDLRWHAGHGFYTHQEIPFTGVAFTIEGGVLTSETEYQDGLRSGAHQEWYPEGGLAAEGAFRGGTIHGVYREWYPDGRLAAEETGEYGILLSEKRWDESGRLVKEYAIEEGGGDWQTLQLCRQLYGNR